MIPQAGGSAIKYKETSRILSQYSEQNLYQSSHPTLEILEFSDEVNQTTNATKCRPWSIIDQVDLDPCFSGLTKERDLVALS